MGRHKRRRNKKDSFGNKRKRRFNRHHIVNKCRGGSMSSSNLLRIDVEKHRCWHELFKNMDFLQVARLLARCYAMKNGIKDYKLVFVPVHEEKEYYGEGLS
jgi:hypothetical protein